MKITRITWHTAKLHCLTFRQRALNCLRKLIRPTQYYGAGTIAADLACSRPQCCVDCFIPLWRYVSEVAQPLVQAVGLNVLARININRVAELRVCMSAKIDRGFSQGARRQRLASIGCACVLKRDAQHRQITRPDVADCFGLRAHERQLTCHARQWGRT